jgi:hypothetical protein
LAAVGQQNRKRASLGSCVVPGRNLIPSVLVGGCRNILERLPEFSGRFQGAPDIVVFGTAVERNELKTMRALLLKAVANHPCPFSKHHRALAALYLDFVVDHGRALRLTSWLLQRVVDVG